MGRTLGMVMLVGTLDAACSRQALVAVAPCPDGGGGFPSCEHNGGDTPSLRTGLVGLWHLDETSGAIAFDSSGLPQPNNGTLKELDPAAAWVPGVVGGGALATRGLGYVLVPRSPSIDAIKGAVTVAAWVYLEGTIVNYATAISRQIGTGIDQYYHLALDGQAHPHGYVIRNVPETFIRELKTTILLPPMTWMHMAVTYDGSNARLYVDGTEAVVKPITGSFGDDTTPLILGANGNNAIFDERFPGLIDEVVLYNRALTALEVRELASGTSF